MLSAIGRAAIRRTGSTQSSARVGLQLQRIYVCQGGSQFSIENSACIPQLFVPVKRTYATTTAQETTLKVKRATTTAKKPAAKATKTKSVANKSKPAAKKAAKPKAKPKPVKKKVLTEKMKLKLEAAKSKDQTRQWKEAALLDTPKQLPNTGFRIHFFEKVESEKEKDGVSRPVSVVASEASSSYKSLDTSTRERLEHTAAQNRITNENAYKAWLESHTPDEIRKANLARLALNRKLAKHKYSVIKDSRVPKKNRSARVMFFSERWQSGDMKGITAVDGLKALNEAWGLLSASEKKPFEDAAAADTLRYQQDFRSVFNREASHVQVKEV